VAALERVSPNGRVLWVFTPYDWPHGNPWGSRAVGPFANPDHLADYLDLVLPLVVIGFLRPAAFNGRRRTAVRLFCGGAVIIVGSALLLSSSRGGWFGAAIGFAVIAGLWPKKGGPHRVSRHSGMAWGSVGLFILLVLLVLLVLGPGGISQTDLRLEQTVGQDSLVKRLQ